MSGSITIREIPPESDREVVLLGLSNGRQILVLGTSGTQEAWDAACGLAGVLGAVYEGTDTLVVDVVAASVRPARLARFINGNAYDVQVTETTPKGEEHNA